MPQDLYADALKYHKLGGVPGKIAIQPTKPFATQRDLSLAYSPGVAEPCRRIHEFPGNVYEYTNKGNLVAVISNGTAVLGLGDIGPLAAKPVMEGKAILFKRFADIDVYDIEIDAKDPERFIAAVEAIAPTFGGINLEDIKGPECFYIERELSRRLSIPVFHDDQHGTAIIASAALLNACELTGRNLGSLRCVFNGAGAAGISTARLFLRLGVRRENIIMCDSAGVIYAGREERMSPEKEEFAARTDARTLAEAMVGADCFVGCSVGNVVTPDMLKSMAKDPIVFAMANPTPEIDYDLAVRTRDDVIMATGRSDHPNQVNNVLGFPFIFRGALDSGACCFNEEMKLAAVRSLAALAKEPVPDSVSQAYGGERFEFGRHYLIPKPFDPRVLYWESVAVAEAAIRSGVATRELDLEEYRERLRRKVEAGRALFAVPRKIAQDKHCRIAIPEGHLPRLASVARRTIKERLAVPVLVGPTEEVRAALKDVDPALYEIADPASDEHVERFLEIMRRQRPLDEGVADADYLEEMRNPFVYATLLAEAGLVDGVLAASNRRYAEMVRPILKYASRRAGVSRVAGLHILVLKDRHLFMADTTLITYPSAEELAEIAMRAARVVRRLNITPRVAFVSYANFATRADAGIDRLKRAYKTVRQVMPELESFPDVQADVALNPSRYRGVFKERIPEHPANILIFPDLFAANAAFRLTRELAGATTIGPMLLGLRRPANVMPRGATEDEILHMMAVTAYNAHRRRVEIEEGRKTQTWAPGAGGQRIAVAEAEDPQGIR
ncbi:MAG: NADP-dependent malic enzyme [Planctomycetota bacterium]|nr:MAG: NADP-dependent malic enzyme [Planctomycetota bacterium]